MFGDLALDATVVASNAVLNAILTELNQKLEQGQEVALDAATLAALESITATVANFPAVQSVDDNGSSLTVDPYPASASAPVQVPASVTNVTLLAANANRKGFIIVNDGNQSLYVKFGATATTTSYTVKLTSGQTYESPSGIVYTGIIDGIWNVANGNAYVTELT